MKNQLVLAILTITVLACSNNNEKVVSMDAKSLKNQKPYRCLHE